MQNIKNKRKKIFGRSPFFFCESITSLSGRKILGTSEFRDKTIKSIESMGNAIKILSLGIDYFIYKVPLTYSRNFRKLCLWWKTKIYSKSNLIRIAITEYIMKYNDLLE